MAGLQVPISGEPASTTIASTDILVAVIGATTKKITAGNMRAQMFAFGAADPLNCGNITASGASTITGALSGITSLGVQTITGATMTGDLLFTDATYDIGKTGATRPRDGFFSRDIWAADAFFAGVNPATTGTFNLPYQGAIAWRNATNTGNIVGLSMSTNVLMVCAIGLTVGLMLTASAGLTVSTVGITVTAGGIVLTSGTVVAPGTATTGGLNIQRVGTPSTPNDGDKWITTANEFSRINGVTQTIQRAAGRVVGDQVAGWTVQTTAQTRADMGAAPVVGTVATTLAALIADLRTHGLIAT